MKRLNFIQLGLYVVIISLALACKVETYDDPAPAVHHQNAEDAAIGDVSFRGLESTGLIDDQSVVLYWLNDSDILSYTIYEVTNNGMRIMERVDAPATSHQLKGLLSATSYTFRVGAQYKDGREIINNTYDKFVTTLSAPPAPILLLKATPAYSFDVSDKPSFTIYGVRPGDTVSLYSDACFTKVGESVSIGTTAVVGSSSLPAPSTYNFFAKITNSEGVDSLCSATFSQYTYQVCPSGYIQIPVETSIGNSLFCVMQYEAKAWVDVNSDGVASSAEVDSDGCNEAGCSTQNWGASSYIPGSSAYGLPWRMINQETAKSECRSLGSGYDLISNSEWMSIARNIEGVASNWSSGSLGVGCLNKGNNGIDDKCSYQALTIEEGTVRSSTIRHGLSNLTTIYDFSGNVSEWVDYGKSELLTPAPVSCSQSWMGIEIAGDFCSALNDRDFLSLNKGNLTFTTQGNINNIAVDINSRVYMATDGGLAYGQNGVTTFKNYTALNGIAMNEILGGVTVDANGHVYVGTSKGLGISTNGGETFSLKTTADGLASNNIKDIFVDAAFNIYVATTAGLSISSNAGVSFSSKTTGDGLGSDQTLSVFANSTGTTIYVGTIAGFSVSTNSGVSFSNRTMANGLGSNRVQIVYEDVVGSVFAGTNNGLSISTDGGTSFTNKTIADGLGSNDVRDITAFYNTADPNSIKDYIYIATMNGMAFSTDRGATFTNRTIANGLADSTVLSVAVSDSGYLFVGTEAGLSVSSFKASTFEFTKNESHGLGGQTSVGYGQVFGGFGESIIRGGSYLSGEYAGVYMMNMASTPKQSFSDTGFRCVYRP